MIKKGVKKEGMRQPGPGPTGPTDDRYSIRFNKAVGVFFIKAMNDMWMQNVTSSQWQVLYSPTVALLRADQGHVHQYPKTLETDNLLVLSISSHFAFLKFEAPAS